MSEAYGLVSQFGGFGASGLHGVGWRLCVGLPPRRDVSRWSTSLLCEFFFLRLSGRDRVLQRLAKSLISSHSIIGATGMAMVTTCRVRIYYMYTSKQATVKTRATTRETRT